MSRQHSSNDNRNRGEVERERDYAASYIATAFAHFKEQGIGRQAVADAVLGELFKTLDSNPFRTGADEAALVEDQGFLWSLKHRIVPMSAQWDKGWLRLQREKRLAFRFNRAAAGPKPAPLPRRQALPPDYPATLHRMDLLLLHLKPGFAYTEGEVLQRYRRKLLRALENRFIDGQDRVKYLAEAKQRLLGWIRRGEVVTDRGTA